MTHVRSVPDGLDCTLPLNSESWTLLVESYACQILHVSINLVLLERLRPEIYHVALRLIFLSVNLLSSHN